MGLVAVKTNVYFGFSISLALLQKFSFEHTIGHIYLFCADAKRAYINEEFAVLQVQIAADIPLKIITCPIRQTRRRILRNPAKGG